MWGCGFLMNVRVIFSALASLVLLAPVNAVSQELALAPVPKLVLPTAPPALSPDCNSKRIAGERFRRPLRALSRAVRAKRDVKILAIGSSSTVGVGASSPSAAYVARLETSLEGSLQGMDFDVVGRGLSGEVAQGAADRMKREVEETNPDLVIWQLGTNDALRHVAIDGFKNCLKKTLVWLKEQSIDVILINPQYSDTLVQDPFYKDVVAIIDAIAREQLIIVVDRFD